MRGEPKPLGRRLKKQECYLIYDTCYVILFFIITISDNIMISEFTWHLKMPWGDVLHVQEHFQILYISGKSKVDVY